MVTTQILIAVARSPRDGKAGDESSRRGLGLMGTQNGEAFPRKIFRIGFALLQRGVCLYGFLPAGDVAGLGLLEIFVKAGDGIPCRIVRVLAKAKRQRELSLRLGKIDSS